MKNEFITETGLRLTWTENEPFTGPVLDFGENGISAYMGDVYADFERSGKFKAIFEMPF